MRAVLIIEDDHELRVSLRQTFESHGYFVYSAGTAIEGIATLKRIDQACLIFLSTSVRLMSYEEFLELKSQDVAKRSVPVVLLTNQGERVANLTDVLSVLEKPLSMVDALKAVEDHCG